MMLIMCTADGGNGLHGQPECSWCWWDAMQCGFCCSSCSGCCWPLADLHIPKAQCVAVAIRCLKALSSVVRGAGGSWCWYRRELQAYMANAAETTKAARKIAQKKLNTRQGEGCRQITSARKGERARVREGQSEWAMLIPLPLSNITSRSLCPKLDCSVLRLQLLPRELRMHSSLGWVTADRAAS